MHQQVLDQKTKSLLKKVSGDEILKDFYLAGGTAIALQYGHRKSIDLDWFNQKGFDTNKLKENLSRLGEVVVESEGENTLNLTLSNVKLSFFGYSYNLLFPLIDWEGIKLADEKDIACMKLSAISSRGSKKDFIDLFFTLKKYPLSELLELFNKKYQNIKYNEIHILKSLTYFTDADKEPMPIMLKHIDWEEIKEYIKAKVKSEIK